MTVIDDGWMALFLFLGRLGLAGELEWLVFVILCGLGVFPNHQPLITSHQLFVGGLGKEVSGVKVAFGPGFFGGLGELQIIKAKTEIFSKSLRMLGPILMTQTVIRKAKHVA